MEQIKDNINLIILDTCRNDPFVRSWRRSRALYVQGLATVDIGGRTFIAFATSPGGLALDGTGRNETFTKHILEHISTPGLEIEQLFKKVRKGVVEETQNQQIPWDNSSLINDFYFNPVVDSSLSTQ